MFRDALGEIEPISTDEHRSHYMVSASNHYHTPKRFVKYQTHIPYTATEDPFGAIEVMRLAGKEELIRTTDNNVDFFEKKWMRSESGEL